MADKLKRYTELVVCRVEMAFYYDARGYMITKDDVENDECLIRFLSRFPHQEIVKWAKSIQDKKQTKYSERINTFLEYYDEDYVDILVRMFI